MAVGMSIRGSPAWFSGVLPVPPARRAATWTASWTVRMISIVSPIKDMKRLVLAMVVVTLFGMGVAGSARAQVDESDLGAWYMYFFNAPSRWSQWGVQGDLQFRNWDLGGDLEQLLIRGGLTWTSKSSDVMLTLGYASVTSGEFGSGDSTSHENRTYLEALLPHKIADRLHLRHRFRFEQRWVEDQDFRTRFRYGLFVDLPLNQTDLSAGAWYLAAYDELFINGQRDIGDGRNVEIFDRNRLYGALGHSVTDQVKIQLGYMYQYTDEVGKGQLQLSLHQTF